MIKHDQIEKLLGYLSELNTDEACEAIELIEILQRKIDKLEEAISATQPDDLYPQRKPEFYGPWR